MPHFIPIKYIGLFLFCNFSFLCFWFVQFLILHFNVLACLLLLKWPHYAIILFSGVTRPIASVRVSRCRTWNVLERHYFAKSQHHQMKHHLRHIVERSTVYQKSDAHFLVHATSGQPLESEPDAYSPKSTSNSILNALDAFYRFSRPHTVIGTVKFNYINASLTKVKCSCVLLLAFKSFSSNLIVNADKNLQKIILYFLFPPFKKKLRHKLCFWSRLWASYRFLSLQ